ncbi:MAG: DUF1549 domain-containing protein, partial [Planctomycetaceae bacterium]
KDKIASNTPTDKMVQELLSARGGSFSSPATNYYQTETETLKVAENVAQVFMGMRMQCAQCHNHPFDRWTMDDYYGFAAFFSQIGSRSAQKLRGHHSTTHQMPHVTTTRIEDDGLARILALLSPNLRKE